MLHWESELNKLINFTLFLTKSLFKNSGYTLENKLSLIFAFEMEQPSSIISLVELLLETNRLIQLLLSKDPV